MHWTKRLKTRSDHICFGCLHDILKGTANCLRVKEAMDGRWFEDYYCPPCGDVYVSLDWDNDIDSVYPGDIGEIRAEREQQKEKDHADST